MADTDTKATPTAVADGSSANSASSLPDLPGGWMYKPFKLPGGRTWYASPKVQLILVAMVCFLCPGMFNALSGLGGGGLKDVKTADHANVALYSTFAVVGFFAGTFTNTLGIRVTLAFGGLGYCIYAAAFLCYSHTANNGFVLFAGALLGVCAGLLWTAQGAIMMSYPPENLKGRYISWFWMIFNLGAVLGSLIPLAQNLENNTGTVTDGTYAGFIVLMFLGAVLALFLCNADRVIREDGSKVILMKSPTWKSEFIGLWETFRSDPSILLLFPMFFSSNIFYTYHFSDVNGAAFNTRTRSLNGLLYWLAQILGASVFGYALDANTRRTVRAKASFAALFVITMAIWGGGYAWQKIQPSREFVTEMEDVDKVDWTDGGKRYIGPMFLFVFYGFYDAAWQTCIYWYMGALSNNGRKATNLAGFYKGIQSAGAAIFWRLDSLGKSYMTMFAATWGCLAASLVIAAPIIFMKIQDTTNIEDDLKFSDETLADVVATKHEKEAA